MNYVFFSYKGGVGRTTALVNAAYQLSKEGKDVFLIDLDIQAPGFAMFDELRPRLFVTDKKHRDSLARNQITEELRDEFVNNGYPLSHTVFVQEHARYADFYIWKIEDMEKKKTYFVVEENNRLNIEYDYKGVLEYFSKIGKGPTEGLDKYVYEIRKEDAFDGTIRIMRVSRPKNYAELKGPVTDRLSMIGGAKDWEILVAHIKKKYKPEYILTDARPGYEEFTEGVLTAGTSNERAGTVDALVFCTDWNTMIIRALSDAASEIINSVGKGIFFDMIMIKEPPPPLPSGFTELLKARKASVQRHLELLRQRRNGEKRGKGHELISIPYCVQLALDYRIIKDDPVVCIAYKKLADRIISVNPDDIVNKIKDARKEGGNTKKAIEKFEELIRNPKYNRNYIVFFEYGKDLIRYGEFERASQVLERAYEKTKDKGYHPEITFKLGEARWGACRDNARLSEKEKRRHMEGAIKCFKKAEELEYGKTLDLYDSWANALIDYAKILEEKGAQLSRLEDAARIIKMVTEKTWEIAEAKHFDTLGKALTEKSGSEKEVRKKIELLEKANEAFHNSEIRGGGFAPRYERCKNLYHVALMSGNVEHKIKCLNDADELYAEVVEYEKESAEAYYWWGIVLALLAKYKVGDTRRDVLVRASDKLNYATNLRKDYSEAHLYLGAVLLRIWEEEEIEQEKSLYFRKGFYDLEWTVSLYVISKYEKPYFYFKAEEIEEFEMAPYSFVRTVENICGREPSLFEEWVGKVEVNEDYRNTIEKAIKREVNGGD